MDEIAELHWLASRAVAAMFDGPDAELRLTPGGVLAVTGEPVADLNMLVLTAHAVSASERLLAETAALIDARGLPLVALAPPDVGTALGSTAARLGLDAAGTMPLMVLRDAPRRKAGAACRIEAAHGAEGARVAGALVSAAFELPAQSVDRVYAASCGAPGVANYVAYDDGAAASSVTATRAGPTVGIWSMATPPERQGKGLGRALLTGVIDQLHAEGVERFYLFATAAGRPLYESLGFETLADDVVWVRGHSTQASGAQG